MNSLQRHLLVAGLVGSLGLAAFAQTQAPPPAAAQSQPPSADRAAQPQQHGDRMQKKVERKLGKLKQQLQITAAQEPAWTAWAGAVKPGARMQRPSRQEFAALTTPERIDRIRAARTQRDAEMDRRLDATKSFYTTLTAEQKKVFDDASLRFVHHHGKRGFSHRG